MKKLTLVTLTLIVIVAMFSVFTSQETTRAADTAEFASNAHGLVDATNEQPDISSVNFYARYPRPVQVAECGNDGASVVYETLKTSEGGYTYSKMWFIVSDTESCPKPVAPVVNKITREDKPVTTVTPESPVVPVAPVVEPEQPETPVIVPVVPADDKPADTCENGNPGNLKCVGNAGEDPNNKGTMPLDNAGGNGNGEHGNQGQGGNSSNNPNK